MCQLDKFYVKGEGLNALRLLACAFIKTSERSMVGNRDAHKRDKKPRRGKTCNSDDTGLFSTSKNPENNQQSLAF